MDRAIAYIDGFNLYFGLKAAVKNMGKRKLPKKAYWLDVQKLAEKIVKKNELVAVKFFTARIKGDYQKQLRQNAYLNAIQTYCPKIQIYEGRYLLRDIFCSNCRIKSFDFVCPHCGKHNKYPEEKKSDVNIATQMMKDAYENKFDVAYLISGDSDFVPPIQEIRSMVVSKRVGVAFPPNQGGSKELRSVSDFSFFIPINSIKDSMLPRIISKNDETQIEIPSEWDT